MIEPHEHIIVGVSGGADSVCLLFLLCGFAKELPFRISVVHVNHGLRKTAGRDAHFVEKLCAEYDVPCFVEKVDVMGLVKEKGYTVEEAARKLRFQAFRDWKDKLCADRIALAHHKGDQAETVLFRLCRGTGIDGLCGIRPVREDVIHPLLCADRGEIEALIEKEGLPFVTDETNAGTLYKRNVIRHNVMPVLTGNICSGTEEHIAQTAAVCLEASDYLSRQTQDACRFLLKELPSGNPASEGETDILIDNALKEYHPYLQKSVVHEAVARRAGARKDIGMSHIVPVLGLFQKQVGKSISLPYRIKAYRTYEGVLLAVEAEKEETPPDEDGIAFDIQELTEKMQEFQLSDGKILSIRAFPYEKAAEIPKKTYTKWFDYDKIVGHLMLRKRRTGDYFYLDNVRRQTVKAYMINNKIAGRIRNQIPVIAEGNHILWIIGCRISNFYKVSEYTNRILEITIRGGTYNG